MKLTATKFLKRYAGKHLKAGEVFEAKPADVRILLAIKHATKYVEPPKPVPAVFKPFVKAIEAKEMPDGDEEKPKRAYKRRDMTAE